MLMRLSPAQAYRRVELDAFIMGAAAADLTAICFDEAIGAIRRAIFAHDRASPDLRDRSLLTAINSIDALRLGVDRNHALAHALLTIYHGAGMLVRSSMRQFDAGNLQQAATDLSEIRSIVASPRPADNTSSSATALA
ncbi:flagellar protein FliS [Croceicoccus sp. F390]|uniref:Flagellar protein FliS n=1 Tax=Croceicoccus esteveae TaxID=3075597 RepID=A0ABU2ZDJ8_9SPHN|nr:flagellar protein FliS [Croceicoccus sp. F390]MDT0574676.1 flagellar protein FliS [Croceicoccus sp. F390]